MQQLTPAEIETMRKEIHMVLSAVPQAPAAPQPLAQDADDAARARHAEAVKDYGILTTLAKPSDQISTQEVDDLRKAIQQWAQANR